MTHQSAAPEWFTRAVSVPSESRFVEVDGTRVHYLSWNAGDLAKPGLLLAHGFRAHARWWSFIAPLLTLECQVVAIDLSGHGDSGRREEYPRDIWAEEVMAVAEHAGIVGAPIVVGHSMGGFVTMATAARYGDRLAGAVSGVDASPETDGKQAFAASIAAALAKTSETRP